MTNSCYGVFVHCVKLYSCDWCDKKLMVNSWAGDTGRISRERKDEEQESVHRRDTRRHREETVWKRDNAM